MESPEAHPTLEDSSGFVSAISFCGKAESLGYILKIGGYGVAVKPVGIFTDSKSKLLKSSVKGLAEITAVKKNTKKKSIVMVHPPRSL